MEKTFSHNVFLRSVLWVGTAALLTLLLSVNVTPLHPWMLEDGAVFYTMGQPVLHGKVLYLDIFDNKGPLLFFLQAFAGAILSGKWGLYLLSTLWLAVSLELLYRIGIKVRASVKRVLCGTALYLAVMMWCMWQGNTTEEWSMPFILGAVYILISLCLGSSRWQAYFLPSDYASALSRL